MTRHERCGYCDVEQIKIPRANSAACFVSFTNWYTTMSKTYTWEEVAKHNTKADCWVVFEGKVLNITNFLSEHPGGEEVIMDHAGKDITQPFEDIGHSENAKELSEKYIVGKVVCI